MSYLGHTVCEDIDDHTSTNTITEKQLGTHTRMETKIGNEKKKSKQNTNHASTSMNKTKLHIQQKFSEETL